MTDDEAIALMSLHYGHGPHTYADQIWLVQRDGLHPVEVLQNTINDRYHWKSAGEVARAYCLFYKLEITPCEGCDDPTHKSKS